jgi:hypothetical protein
VYTIYPSGTAVQVYCDQTTDGGGWTVFLRRHKQEPQLNFSRTFKEYEEGFGCPSGEYWLGNTGLTFNNVYCLIRYGETFCIDDRISIFSLRRFLLLLESFKIFDLTRSEYEP